MSVKVGIVGASGYSGETLVRILGQHPQVELAAITSRSLAGKSVSEVFPQFRGRFGGLTFSSSDPDQMTGLDVDIWFLALPHGVASIYAQALVEAGKQVIDLSADFRLGDVALYKEYYKVDHPNAELMLQAPYVLPEIACFENPEWTKERLIACPGCYPTSVEVPLYPLLKKGLLDLDSIVVNALSGVSGAGKKASEFYSYCERAESLMAYGAPRHRHVSEIEEQLSAFAGRDINVQFTPHLIPMRYGIATTIVAKAKADLDALYEAWNEAYADAPFIQILATGSFPDTKYVVGTNRVDMSAVKDERTGNFVITSAIDNLIKGASGQAVQIMNILCGFDPVTGL